MPGAKRARPPPLEGDEVSPFPASTASATSAAAPARAPPPRNVASAVTEFAHGFCASSVSILLTFPLSKLTSRQAYEGLSVRAALATMRREGGRHIYRGVPPPLLQKGVAMGVCYGAYDFYFHELTRLVEGRDERRAATDVPMAEGSLAVRAAAAIASGSTEALFTPFERVQTILQHRHYTDRFANTWDVYRKLRPYGVREFFRGGSAILLRNGPSNAAFFLLREPVRGLLPPAPPPLLWGGGGPAGAAWDSARDFFSGAVLGASLSTLFYPINLAKGVMQLQIGGASRSVAVTLANVYRDRNGLAGVYRGAGGNAARALLSWGIVNTSYELLKGTRARERGKKDAALA